MEIWAFIVLAGVLFVYFAVSILFQGRCPRCRKFFAGDMVDKSGFSDSSSEKGKAFKVRYRFRCRHCGHRWDDVCDDRAHHWVG